MSDSATPWTVAYQAPPSAGFSRRECWSGLPFPSPGDLPNPGIKPRSPMLQADALLSEPRGSLTVPVLGSNRRTSRCIWSNLACVPKSEAGTSPCRALIPALGGWLVPLVCPPLKLLEGFSALTAGLRSGLLNCGNSPNSSLSWRVYPIPEIGLSALQRLSLIFPVTLGSRPYHPCFIDEENEAQRSYDICRAA